MDETFPFSDQNELSPEDQAVLDAFLAMDDMEPLPIAEETSAAAPIAASTSQTSTDLIAVEDDMLVLFATEAEEDIDRMRQSLQQLEQSEQVDAPAFTLFQRAAHKLKGTAGAIGCDSLSAIARHIEMVIKQIRNKEVAYGPGLLALTHAVQALEITLESVISEGSENQLPRMELEEEYKTLSAGVPGVQVQGMDQPAIATDGGAYPGSRSLDPARADIRRLDQLMLHSERMLELHAPLESAQQQVEAAFAELQNAQARLRRLETMYSPFAAKEANTGRSIFEEQPASSLIERILHESVQRTGHAHKLRARSTSSQFPTMQAFTAWDEMEVDRFNERNVFAISLNEAIADVTTAAAQLRQAFTQLNTLLKQHMEQGVQIRNDALSLHAVPFSVFVDRLRSASQSITAEKQIVQFEVSGETTEIDQDILDALTNPFLGLVTESALAAEAVGLSAAEAGRITFAARSSGNEVTIEAGFSMPVPGGIIEELNTAIHNLHGSITPHRDSAEGIVFQLRFPRSLNAVQGLLVRVGNQSVVVPFSQVHHIDYNRQAIVAERYDLNELLDFPSAKGMPQTISPWLILAEQTIQLAVQVDEILGQVDLVMKPLAEYLRRPGILGTTIDGIGNVLLVVNLPGLIIQNEKMQKQKEPVKVFLPAGQARFQNHPEPAYSKILIADDSVSIRQSLRQILGRVGYQLYEARDGMEALELILEQPPDVLLLDIEMPNLNGFDLLTIMHASPLLSKLKTILLTSRSSDKHIQQAFELGAYDFLAKPCPADVLLKAVQSALDS